jgi:SAM-dependent MidA family methyltransferase
MVFSYELFDALPLHRLIGGADGEVHELLVSVDADGAFRFAEGELSDPQLKALLGDPARDLRPGQIADLSPHWRPLYRQLANTLERGLLITCDYGFERPQLLDDRIRHHGTLACYRRHTVHRNALADLGTQDLTAHVDFTALREEGELVGLETVAFTRQARWLVAGGVFERLRQDDPTGRLAARTLLDPEGMGEEIRVLVQARSVDAARLLDAELLGVGKR